MKDVIKKIIELNGYVLKITNEEITHNDSIVMPDKGGNCYNFVLGHIVLHRSYILARFDIDLNLSSDYENIYNRGANQEDYYPKLLPLETLLNDFDKSHTILMNALEKVDNEFLLSEYKDSTRIDSLTKLIFHETYHIGQLSSLRRVLGKEGVIK